MKRTAPEILAFAVKQLDAAEMESFLLDLSAHFNQNAETITNLDAWALSTKLLEAADIIGERKGN